MKCLIIVIHSSAQQTLADCLRSIDKVTGFTFTHVEGHSHHSENDVFLSARDKVAGYVPRVRVEILLNDEDVKVVLGALKSKNCVGGQGFYWVMPVEELGRI